MNDLFNNTEPTPSVQDTNNHAESHEPNVAVDLLQTPHDAFDWSVGKKQSTAYSQEDRKALDDLYKDSFTKIENKQITEGTIMGIADNSVIVSVGYKFDALIPLNEFKEYDEELRVGNKIPVMVMNREDIKGNLILSYKETKIQGSWEKIVAAYNSGEIVVGKVIDKSKGGLVVELFGLNVFLPGSQIDVRVVTDYDQYIGKKIEFKVIKLNKDIKNAVVSHKVIIEGKIEEQRLNIIEKLEKGQVVEGVVKNITDFGVFMDLGNIDGLLYITDISWKRISHPSEMFHVDQRVNVVILDFDYDKKRISLGLKQLTPHPWDALSKDIQVGSEVEGVVVNVEDYGGFLEIYPGVEGLVHVSEISWSNTPVQSKEFFKVGAKHKVKVITLDHESRKMSLSVKQLTPDPWENILTTLPEGSKHKGEVKNITNYGVFVELENGFGGMIHISDISWTKRISHPKEVTSLGAKVDVVVLKVDLENRKILLGQKQLQENPWDLLRDRYTEGSTHKGKVTRKQDSGAIVELEFGIEGYTPGRHLMTKDNKILLVGETADFIVLEFHAEEKKLILSHRKTWETLKEQDEVGEHDEQATIKKRLSPQNRTDKSVIGDIGGLSNLRDKLKEQEDKKEE